MSLYHARIRLLKVLNPGLTRVLGHDGDDGLVHLSVVVLGEALVGADIGGGEAVDLELDDAVAAVGAGELLSDLNVLALVLERHLNEDNEGF